MNAAQLIDHVNECGGRVWLEADDTVKCKAPPELVALLRQHKAEIIDLLRRRDAKAVRRAKACVWRFILEGKSVFVIDHEELDHVAMLRYLQNRFGADRVGQLFQIENLTNKSKAGVQ